MRHPGRNDAQLVGLLQYALTPREPYRIRVHNGTCPGFLFVSFEAEYSCDAIMVQTRGEALGTFERGYFCLQGTTGCCRLLLLQGATGCYRVFLLQAARGYNRLLHGTA